VVDTGAYMSVIPYQIWKGLKYIIISNESLQGIHPHSNCSIPSKVAWVGMALHDSRNQTPPQSILAYLTPKEFVGVPLILGLAGLLEKGQMTVNLEKRFAQLEIS